MSKTKYIFVTGGVYPPRERNHFCSIAKLLKARGFSVTLKLDPYINIDLNPDPI